LERQFRPQAADARVDGCQPVGCVTDAGLGRGFGPAGVFGVGSLDGHGLVETTELGLDGVVGRDGQVELGRGLALPLPGVGGAPRRGGRDRRCHEHRRHEGGHQQERCQRVRH